MLNKIAQGNTLEVLKGMEAESVNMVMSNGTFCFQYSLIGEIWNWL